MGKLDAENIIEKTDSKSMLQSINDLPSQIEDAWNILSKFTVPTYYLKCTKILIVGMGGSAIGGDLVGGFALNYSKCPIVIQRDYGLPSFVDSNTLVIGVSYSGGTEETLDAFEKAGEKGAKLIAITTGGKLESLASKYQAPVYKFEYGSEPRAALGYLFIAVLGVLNKLGMVEIGANEISEAIKSMKDYQKEIGFESPTSQNPAKQLAEKLVDKYPVIMGAGTLSVVAKRWKTQLNENSKQAAFIEIFPELCHNFIIGLDFPKKINDNLFIVSLESDFDHPRNKIRQNVLYQVFRKKGIKYESVIEKKPQTALIEMLNIIMLGDYVSYYLAILNNTDPSPVEMIKYLKDKLSQIK